MNDLGKERVLFGFGRPRKNEPQLPNFTREQQSVHAALVRGSLWQYDKTRENIEQAHPNASLLTLTITTPTTNPTLNYSFFKRNHLHGLILEGSDSLIKPEDVDLTQKSQTGNTIYSTDLIFDGLERIKNITHRIIDRSEITQIIKDEKLHLSTISIVDFGKRLYEQIPKLSPQLHQLVNKMIPNQETLMFLLKQQATATEPQTEAAEIPAEVHNQYRYPQMRDTVLTIFGQALLYEQVTQPNQTAKNWDELTTHFFKRINYHELLKVDTRTNQLVKTLREEQYLESQRNLDQERRKLAKWTEDFVVKQKKPQPPASPNLHYSIQMPVFNEMPSQVESSYNGSDPIEIGKIRGNLAESLYSIGNSLRLSGKNNKVAPEEVEILVNVNNNEGIVYNEKNGTLENQRALKLIQTINELKNTNQSFDELVNQLDWVPNTQEAQLNPPKREVRNFYIRLLTLYKGLLKQGMQIHAIDCTDGMRITRESRWSRDPINTIPTIGDKRRLLASVAKRRFLDSRTKRPKNSPQGEICIPLDADVVVKAGFFTALSQFKNETRPIGIRTPPNFIPVVSQRKDRPELTQEVNLSAFYRDLLYASKGIAMNIDVKIKKAVIPQIQTPWPGTYYYTQQAYDRIPGFDISLYQDEDADLIAQFNQASIPRVYIPRQLTGQRDRLRPESFLGHEKSRLSRSLVLDFNNQGQIFIKKLSEKMNDRTILTLDKSTLPGYLLKMISQLELTTFEYELVSKLIDLKKTEAEIMPHHKISKTNELWLVQLQAVSRLARIVEYIQDSKKTPNLSSFFSMIGKIIVEENINFDSI